MTFEIKDFMSHYLETVTLQGYTDFLHSIGDVLMDLHNINFIGIDYIHKNKLSITLKYHRFKVVTFEILDFEGYMYEKVDYFSWRCALGPQYYNFLLKYNAFVIAN